MDPDSLVRGMDPHQNVMDPEHWFEVRYFITLKPGDTSYRAYSYTLARKSPRVHAVKQFHLSGLRDAVGKNGDLLNLKCSLPDNALGQILRGFSVFCREGMSGTQ